MLLRLRLPFVVNIEPVGERHVHIIDTDKTICIYGLYAVCAQILTIFSVATDETMVVCWSTAGVTILTA